jgi:hypothetical protein
MPVRVAHENLAAELLATLARRAFVEGLAGRDCTAR